MSTEVFILVVSTALLFFWLLSLRAKASAIRQPLPLSQSAFKSQGSENNSS